MDHSMQDDDGLQLQGMGCAFPLDSVSGHAFGMSAESGQLMGFERVRDGKDPASTIELWAQAAEAALRDAGLSMSSIAGIIAMRNGFVPVYEGSWLSLVFARALGVKDKLCLDLKGAGCAGVLHAAKVVQAMTRPGDRPVLVVGGGASGYTRRWFPNPAVDDSPAPASGVLVGDGAYAVVMGKSPGKYRVRALELASDPTLADAWHVEGQNYRIADADLSRWLAAASGWCTRVVAAAMMKARVAPAMPLFFVGTNAGKDVKTEQCRQTWKRSDDPRFRTALDAQLASMKEHGHLFGGDVTANLCTLRDAALLAAGDRIMCLEAGGTYLYTAAVLEVA
jgi:3-oxoacyl-[acyl-carrier-protein] synthase III